jgi:tRNA threonylcarbamoyl adenosine modification protein YeaZ
LLILSCDTSTDFAVFAIGDDSGHLISHITIPHERNLSKRFFSTLDELFCEANVQLKDIDFLSVGIGPGSFTGVRVSVTTIKTIAQVTGKRLIGIGTLEAYACDANAAPDVSVFAVLPSRRGEVYCQRFHGTNGAEAPTVVKFDDLFTLMQCTDGDKLLCGQTNCLPPLFDGWSKTSQTAPPASAMIKLTADKIADGVFDDVLALKPVYAASPAISRPKTR